MSENLSRDSLWRSRRPYQRRKGGFQTVQLNFVGWAALIGVGLAAGIILSLVTALPPLVALVIGVSGAWILFLLTDHYRWRNGMIHMCRDDMDPSVGASIVTRLEEMGITATYSETTVDDEGDGPLIQRGILCRHADAETVSRVLLRR